MTENGCQHFIAYKKEFDVKTFTLVHGCFSACVNKEARKRKALSCLCFECGSSGPLLFSCLHCIYFGCKGEHILNHLKEKNHTIALELSYGTLYCSSCKDFIYDEECRKIAEKHLGLEARSLNRKLSWRPWIPTPAEVDLLLQHSRRKYYIGLRGLINLGLTCFMNVIIQTFLRTPILSGYFLSDQHKCKLKLPSECLVCELSKVFQEFCSDKREPLSLHHLLRLVWNHAKYLAGYAQNDAHEFLMAALDILHKHCTINENSDNQIQEIQNNGKETQCDCIIDQTFTGFLQSDVVCRTCNGVSTTIESCKDISLDLGEDLTGSAPPKSIIECLERYTRVEYLPDSDKIKCSNCMTFQPSTKQLLIHTLPIVANFHLKRLHFGNKVKKKISTFISFPAELDMTPFMSRKPDNKHNQDNDNDYRYLLYAVVNHEGTYESGHYTAYVRHRKDVWVRCDDEKIRMATFEEVLESEGYILFYHKKILEYK